MSKIGNRSYDDFKADENRRTVLAWERDYDERVLRNERERQKHLFVNNASKGISEAFRVPWLTENEDKEYRISLDDGPTTFWPFRAFYDPFRCGWHVVPWGVSFVAIEGVKVGQLACLVGTRELHVRLHVGWLNQDPERRSDPKLIWRVVREKLLEGIPPEEFGWCLLDLERLGEQSEEEIAPDRPPEEVIKELRDRFGR